MALDDWTLVSDGNTYKRVSQYQPLSGSYCSELLTKSSSNYISMVYHNNNLYSNLGNTKIRCRLRNNRTYLKDTSLWTDVTWASTSATVTATGSKVEKTSGSGGWNAGAVSSQSIDAGYVGAGIRFQPLTNQMSMMVALSDNSNLETTYTGLDHAIYFANTGDTDHEYIVEVWESNAQVYPSSTRDEEQRFIYKPEDIFSIEIGNDGHILYKINGTLFYYSADTSVNYPLYVKAVFNLLASGADNIWIRTSSMTKTSNNKGYPYYSRPFIFTRLQDTTPAITSDCYAMMLKDHEIALVKGNLNQSVGNLDILSTGPSNSEFYGIMVENPQIFSLETVTVNDIEVQIKCNIRRWEKYNNEITSVGDKQSKRDGINYSTIVTDNGIINKAANFCGNSYILIYNDINENDDKYVEFWFNPRNVERGAIFLRMPHYNTVDYRRSYDMALHLRQHQLIFHYFNSDILLEEYFPLYIREHEWYFVAIQKTGASANCDVWVNGTQYYNYTAGGSPPYTTAAKNAFLLGCQTYHQNVERTNFFDGLISQFYMITGALPYNTSSVNSRYNQMLGGSDTGLYDHANKSILFRFTDNPIEDEIINYTDSDSPIITGGRVGFGVYNDTTNEDSTYYDEIEIFTED